MMSKMKKELNVQEIENILNGDIRYLFLAILISSDSLNCKEDCEDSLYILNLINDNIDKLQVKDIDSLREFVKNGLEIVNREIKNYE